MVYWVSRSNILLGEKKGVKVRIENKSRKRKKEKKKVMILSVFFILKKHK